METHSIAYSFACDSRDWAMAFVFEPLNYINKSCKRYVLFLARSITVRISITKPSILCRFANWKACNLCITKWTVHVLSSMLRPIRVSHVRCCLKRDLVPMSVLQWKAYTQTHWGRERKTHRHIWTHLIGLCYQTDATKYCYSSQLLITMGNDKYVLVRVNSMIYDVIICLQFK